MPTCPMASVGWSEGDLLGLAKIRIGIIFRFASHFGISCRSGRGRQGQEPGHGGRQIGCHVVGPVILSFHTCAMSGPDQNRGANASSLPGLQITPGISHHHRMQQIDVVIGGGAQQQPGQRLATLADQGIRRHDSVRVVRAVVDAVDLGLKDAQLLLERSMNLLKICLSDLSPGNMGLIGHHQHLPPGCTQTSNRLGRARQQFQVTSVGYMPALDGNRPVSIQKNHPVSHLEISQAPVQTVKPAARQVQSACPYSFPSLPADHAAERSG